MMRNRILSLILACLVGGAFRCSMVIKQPITEIPLDVQQSILGAEPEKSAEVEKEKELAEEKE